MTPLNRQDSRNKVAKSSSSLFTPIISTNEVSSVFSVFWLISIRFKEAAEAEDPEAGGGGRRGTAAGFFPKHTDSIT